ncbi:MAG TPA: helicase-related protein, partial [Nakamurella sp.]
WVVGVLDRMRAQGAVDHAWFDRYRRDDGHRYSIWGGRPRAQGMPAFPRDRPAPGYPTVGGGRPAGGRARGAARDGGLDAVTSPQSWYSRWGSRVLDVSPADAGRVTKQLLQQLARGGILQTSDSATGAVVYAIAPVAVTVAAIEENEVLAERNLLTCDICRAQTPGSAATVDILLGAPCLVVRCHGHLVRAKPAGEFYRQLYRSTDMRRIVAREHTSLLPDETRQRYEDGFKAAATEPQAPNVLVASPTLEMGIDIGDLSMVLLASLPRTVASYLQRVGRAGRLTGNALDLAYVTGRGEQLPQLGEPLSVINGQVRPPATYLRAEEILRRQYTAHLVDELARDGTRQQPRRAAGAMGSSEPGSFLGELIAFAERGAHAHLPRFLDQFDGLPADVADRLRDWVIAGAGPGSSDLAAHLRRASTTWRATVAELQRRLDVIDALQPVLEVRAGSPAVTDEDRRALRSVISARILTNAQLAGLRGEYWIGVLEQYGVLPNYTLLGDAVVLDVGISWTNPDTDEYEYEPAQIARSSATAIREFAPGSTFYARGLEIAIDAIDLGLDGSAIRPWVFCPRCGFGADVEPGGIENVPTSCPRCGSPDLADTGQRMDVVELTHVSAEVRRDEATISDRADERVRPSFQLVTAVDLDPATILRRWFATNTGIGATYAAELTVRWVNIGLAGHGQDRFLAGELRSGALFRVCAGCGKLDVELGRNVAYEHRPWCRYRTATDEHNRLVALTRTLRTQGLLIRLPRTVTVGDDYAVPSLAATVLLGLREQIGGHPDHLRVEQVVEPTLADGNANHDAILLHDTVPGGTGYLADLAEPAALAALLGLAWERVRTCECRFENRLACHRCLLPFATGTAVNRVSRAAAERHLRTLLGLAPDATGPVDVQWDVGDPPPAEDPESHLEQRFREVFGSRLAALGAAIDTVPGPWGNSLRFTLPGSPRRWTFTPQVMVRSTRPDFVLQTNDTQVPILAIFVDGRAFHPSTQHNRLASDAEQRESLRASGHVVLAVTAADLTDPPPPSWFSEDTVRQLIAQPSFMTSPAAYQRLQLGPVDWLLAWITTPTPDEARVTGRAVPLFLLGGAGPLSVGADCALETVATDVLTGATTPAGSRPVVLWRDGPVAAAIELVDGLVRVAVVLDDRLDSLTGTHADGWRSWLRLSNALALRDWPTVITTTTLVGAGVDVAPTPTADGDLPPAWTQIVREARIGVERDVLRALAAAPGVVVPVLGFEGPEGIPVDIAWPRSRLAIAVDGMPEADRDDLRAAGWTVLDPADTVIEQVLDVLKAGI